MQESQNNMFSQSVFPNAPSAPADHKTSQLLSQICLSILFSHAQRIAALQFLFVFQFMFVATILACVLAELNKNTLLFSPVIGNQDVAKELDNKNVKEESNNNVSKNDSSTENETTD